MLFKLFEIVIYCKGLLHNGLEAWKRSKFATSSNVGMDYIKASVEWDSVSQPRDQ